MGSEMAFRPVYFLHAISQFLLMTDNNNKQHQMPLAHWQLAYVGLYYEIDKWQAHRLQGQAMVMGVTNLVECRQGAPMPGVDAIQDAGTWAVMQHVAASVGNYPAPR